MTAATPVRPSADKTIPVEAITPERAADLLNRNAANRKISDTQVEQFARLMTKGQWLWAGGTILISEDGNLLDGQHRLTAIVKSGTTQYFGVLYDVPALVQDVVDTGRKRSAHDTLKMLGVANSTVSASAIRILLAWASGDIMRAHTIGNIEARSFYEEVGDRLTESVKLAVRAKANGLPINQGALAALHFELSKRADATLLESFTEKVAMGTGLENGDPELALRRILSNKLDQGKRPSRAETLYYLIRAWNARVKGQKLVKMQLPRTGLQAQTFPRPIIDSTEEELPNITAADLAEGED